MNKIKKTCRENKSGCDRWWSTAAPMIHRYGASVVFPIYDGHGNMVYTLSRGANDTFSLGNKRIYGAWGDLRHDGNPGDGPNTQYCANLGHKLDNESGLTYMRARYYEPWTGRFISEDPRQDGRNWYRYAENNPIAFLDPRGEVVEVPMASLEGVKIWVDDAIASLFAYSRVATKLLEIYCKFSLNFIRAEAIGMGAGSQTFIRTIGDVTVKFHPSNIWPSGGAYYIVVNNGGQTPRTLIQLVIDPNGALTHVHVKAPFDERFVWFILKVFGLTGI